MTIVAVVVLTLSVTGTIGIFRPSILVTEIFAVLSFVFGHLIFSIVVSWYLLIFLDTYLSGRFLSDDLGRKHDKPESNIYQDDLLNNYFKLLIAVSLVLMSAGAITTKLLIQTRKNQGYVDVYAENAPQ
uniref:Solute carrier family 22 member 25 n=1 Tax=Lygus hesperus TaxID=30085 RepID=A0A0A9Y9F5_LYGHE